MCYIKSIKGFAAFLSIPSLVFACSKGSIGPADAGAAQTYIELVAPEFVTTKSQMPDENLVSDLNIFVFSGKGELEDSRFIESHELEKTSAGYRCTMQLLAGNQYSMYVCANIGYRLKYTTIEDLENFRYYLLRPDDYRNGMPMSGSVQVFIEDGKPVTVQLKRAMARVQLRVDRSELNEDVVYRVQSVRICGCPRSVSMFKDNRVTDSDGFFANGFSHYDLDADALNTESASGMSDLLGLYMLENKQGTSLTDYCSYIEMKAEYISATHYTAPGKYLTYRFYLGDRRQDFDLCRNCSYTVTVTPHGDGLGGGSTGGSGGSTGGNGGGQGGGTNNSSNRGDLDWRIDKQDLAKFVQSVSLNHKSLSFNYAGQSQALEAVVLPTDAGNSLQAWETSNPDVATVNSNGTVTAVGNGECTITCWATDGSGAKDECRVSVAIDKAWVMFHNVGYQETSVGETMRIWAEYFPPNMSCKIDKEYLDLDVERGIYSYTLSEDASDVSLTFLKKGSGMIRFDVGEPLDTSALVFIHVNP